MGTTKRESEDSIAQTAYPLRGATPAGFPQLVGGCALLSHTASCELRGGPLICSVSAMVGPVTSASVCTRDGLADNSHGALPSSVATARRDLRWAPGQCYEPILMIVRRAAASSCVVTAVWLVACGGSPAAAPAARKAPVTAAAPKAPVTAAAPTAPDASPPPAKAQGKTAADHHRDFMDGCAKKAINSPDYCECAWGEFRKEFTDDEMNAGDLAPAKLAHVKAQVAGACSSKIPEATVKSGFEAGCVGDKPEMKAYCACTWTEFRKRFSPAELGDEATVQSERFIAARKPVVKACGNKMPESVSKAAFLKGCAKEPSAEVFCGCAWKELRKQASPAAIESGTFDQKTIFARLEKSCGKLRPKAK